MTNAVQVPHTSSLLATDSAAVPAEVVARIRAAQRVLTVGHENPDGDSLGFALAMALAVEQLGGRATPVSSDPVPPMYGFMPFIDRVLSDPEVGVDYDLIIVGDCGELTRVGAVLGRNAELFARVPIVNIDHHISNRGFGTLDWIDSSAAATCEMCTLLMPALGVGLDAAGGAIAANLMAGLVNDTANFQHPNVTPRTLRVAAQLVAAGAPLSDTARLIYRTKPNRQLKLLGLVLARLEQDLDGRLVWAALYDDDYAAAGATASDTEGLSDLLSQSASGEIVLMFRQVGDRTKVSARTREGGPDATVLTGAFGGGGHARAAGATVDLPIGEAIPQVLNAARAMLARGD